jgi:hypothetical protein
MEPRYLTQRVYTLSWLERIMRKMWWTLVGLGVAMAPPFAGATEPDRAPRGIAPPTRLPDPAPPAMAAGEPVPTASMPREVRRAVVVDAARRFKVAEAGVVLVRAEKRTWKDGSLGCPQPGKVYTQARVPGFRVVARTSEGDLLYHTDMHGEAVVCVRPTG